MKSLKKEVIQTELLLVLLRFEQPGLSRLLTSKETRK